MKILIYLFVMLAIVFMACEKEICKEKAPRSVSSTVKEKAPLSCEKKTCLVYHNYTTKWVEVRCNNGYVCDECIIGDGFIAVMGSYKNKLLVKYESRSEINTGTRCKSGVVFFLEFDEFLRISEMSEELYEEAVIVRKILEKDREQN